MICLLTRHLAFPLAISFLFILCNACGQGGVYEDKILSSAQHQDDGHSHDDDAHGDHGDNRVPADEGRVQFKFVSQKNLAAGSVSLEFQLLEGNKLLSSSSLEIMHEKKLHMFIFDEALMEYRHVHPEYVANTWKVTTNLPFNGNYRVWAQATLASDKAEFLAKDELTIVGGKVAFPIKALGEKRSNSSGTSKATLSNEVLRAGQSAKLSLSFSRTDGSSTNITPYLGALAHVVAVNSQGSKFIHVHAEESSSDEGGGGHGGHHLASEKGLSIHVNFPVAGEYRIWVQFQDAGMLKTIPLSVRVD